MRKLALLCITGLVALGLAGTSSARPLNWEGTSTLILGDFPPGLFTGGGVATVNGSAGTLPAHLNTLRLAASRGQISGTLTQIVTDPETIGNGVAAIQYVGIEGGTGTLGAISGGAAGVQPLSPNTMPVRGLVKVCLVSTACSSFLPLILTQPTVNGGVKGVGVGGLLTIGGVGAIRMSLQNAPWTIKTATVLDQITTVNNATGTINVILTGFAHGPLSLTTSTAQPSGVVQVVTPVQVRTNLPLGSNGLLASGVTNLIHFVPEPGMLLLLGSGVAGLALLGRRRLRK